MNIKLTYLYRDGANYKKFNEVAFTNSNGLTIEEVENRIKAYLIDGEWFYSDKWGLDDMHFEKWDNEIDHLWHEYLCIEETIEAGLIDIEVLLRRIAIA